VLDDEVGIGFGDHDTARTAPLLADLAPPARSGPRQTAMRPRDVYLMTLLAPALRDGATEIVLTDEDVTKLSETARTPLADTLTAMLQIVARSSDAVARGDYRVRIAGVGRGAQMLGRFCHGSPEVDALTREALRAEEAFHPDAVFAEIVHLPEGRVGNVLLRPVLRDYEIPYLGASGADPDKQIALDDLTVSVAGERVVVRSRRLGREVIPRMTTAHNYSSRSMTVYRFLCSHANQNVGHAYWTWGVLDDMPFLPRVRHGKLVIERARWNLNPRDLAPLEAAFAGASAAKTPDQIRALKARAAAAIAALRVRLRLPRWIVVGDGDNELPVDLDNELMVDSAAHLLKGRKTATIYELLAGPDQLCVHGSEGAFSHELALVLARDAGPVVLPVPAPAPVADTPRRFLPGSSWLYLKLYTGSATADALLRDTLAPAIRDALARGLATGWFFLRYGDPDWHVRLRFAGEPDRLTGELLPFLHRALAPAAQRGLFWKLTADTYEREIERYGGPDGIDAAEHLFHADSECALAILESLEGDAGAEAAWRLALRGMDRMLDDLGFSLTDKLAIATAARDDFGRELGIDTAFQKRLGNKYRTHRNEIAVLLDTPDDDPDHPFGPAFQIFAGRSATLRPLGQHLRELAAADRLSQSLTQLAHSYLHMHVNRMIRSSQRFHELVLYDLLRRHYDGVLARHRHEKPAARIAS
jgi:thiopeptide-type bacteriocin biosynthesis protein